MSRVKSLANGKSDSGKLEIAIFSNYSRVVLCDTTVDFFVDEKSQFQILVLTIR